MSTKAKIIIALVVVAIIVGVTIWLYKKKKAEKGTTTTKTADASTAEKAIKEAGPVIRTINAELSAASPAMAFDFTA